MANIQESEMMKEFIDDERVQLLVAALTVKRLCIFIEQAKGSQLVWELK